MVTPGEPVSIDNLEDVYPISIAPNPSNGLFTIAGTNTDSANGAVIHILDLNGRVVFTKEVEKVIIVTSNTYKRREQQ